MYNMPNFDESHSHSKLRTWAGKTICNGNRTDNHTSDNKIGRPHNVSPINLFITSMITDRIGRHEVLLPINHKKLQFSRKEEYQVMKKGKFAFEALC